MRDNWPGIIEMCIENNFFPKVLFFEKLQSIEDDAEYRDSRSFTLTKTKLSDLAYLAQDLDRLATATMEELYDADELEAQRKMMQQFEQSFKDKANVGSAPEEQKGPAASNSHVSLDK